MTTKINFNQGALTQMLHPYNTSGQTAGPQKPQEETSRVDSLLQVGDVYVHATNATCVHSRRDGIST